jgi:hypothetical protein
LLPRSSWRTDRHGQLGILVCRFSGHGEGAGMAAVVYLSSEVGAVWRVSLGHESDGAAHLPAARVKRSATTSCRTAIVPVPSGIMVREPLGGVTPGNDP